jgi:phage terminase large subunit-like protein
MSLLYTLNKEVKRLKSTYNGIDRLLNGAVEPIILELRETYQKDLGLFYKDFWPYASTSTPLIPGYTFDALKEHLYALYHRWYKFFLFTAPPREAKSTFINVMWPAWTWINNPKERILATSYSDQVAKRDNAYMQRLIMSEPFQQVFGDMFFLIETNKHKTANNLSGERIANSLEGHNTGQGGTIIMFDDPNNIVDADKPSLLDHTNELFDNVFIHRQNDPEKTIFVVNQHRVASNDFYSHIKSKGFDDLISVEMPFEYDSSRKCVTYLPGSNKIFWQDPRTEDGEYINPHRYSKREVERTKKTMSAVKFSSLYQCLPVPDKGGVFSRDWFKIWPHPMPPKFDFVIQSWDTAITVTATASYSACTSWGVFKKDGVHNLMFLNSWHGKEEWNELAKMIARLYYNIHDTDKTQPHHGHAPVDILLIEGKANGLSLVQHLRKLSINALPYIPPRLGTRMYGKNEDGKVLRARLTTPMVESGRIWVMPDRYDMSRPHSIADRFIKACCNFPHNVEAARDIVDTFSMTVDYLTTHNFIQTNDEFQHKNFSSMVEKLRDEYSTTDYTDDIRIPIPTNGDRQSSEDDRY